MIVEEVTVNNSVDFRDAVMRLGHYGKSVFARKGGYSAPSLRVLAPEEEMTLDEILAHHAAPIHMEEFAQAMARHNDRTGGEAPSVVLYTID